MRTSYSSLMEVSCPLPSPHVPTLPSSATHHSAPNLWGPHFRFRVLVRCHRTCLCVALLLYSALWSTVCFDLANHGLTFFSWMNKFLIIIIIMLPHTWSPFIFHVIDKLAASCLLWLELQESRSPVILITVRPSVSLSMSVFNDIKAGSCSSSMINFWAIFFPFSVVSYFTSHSHQWCSRIPFYSYYSLYSSWQLLFLLDWDAIFPWVHLIASEVENCFVYLLYVLFREMGVSCVGLMPIS